MKKITTLLALMISLGCFAQVTVSTLTPQFKGSGGLSLDNDGNLYIGDFGDFLSAGDGDGLPNMVWKLDTDLILSEYSTNFVGASGNDFDSNGVLYQSDIGTNAIYKIVNGVRTFVTSTGISSPVGIIFDSVGNFFVCNCGDNTIRKVTSGGVSTQFLAGNGLFCPNGITIDEDDNLYVSNFSDGKIIKITPAGVATELASTVGGSTSGSSNGHLDYHQPTRTLYIASHGSNKIYSMPIDDPSQLQVLAGSGVRGNDDGDALTATFSRPNGVAISKTGDSIYINSAIPITNSPNRPLNPQVIRLIKGVQGELSVETITNSVVNLKAYPNPVINSFTIEADLFSEYMDLRIRLYDISGKVVWENLNIKMVTNHLNILVDCTKMKTGTYFYTVNNGTNQLFNGKLIKL